MERQKLCEDPVEQVIDEFLEGGPRAEQLAQMVQALQARRRSFVLERDGAPPEERSHWEAAIREIDDQIRVLREEEAITRFVEQSIRATINRHLPDEGEEDLP
ncbi:MAG: hypothetical protein ACP5VE_14100 [Chthonomonadales bacterium]